MVNVSNAKQVINLFVHNPAQRLIQKPKVVHMAVEDLSKLRYAQPNDTLCLSPSIPIIPSFSLEEFNNSIRDYVLFGVNINKLLRGNQKDSFNRFIGRLCGKTIVNLDNIFARTPAIEKKISLHRVIKVNDEYSPNLNIGDIITDKGYMSCSRTYNADILKKNGLPLTEGTPIYLTIDIPEGKQILDVKKYVEYFGKKYKYDEVLINRGSSIRITAKKDNYVQAELL